MTNKSDMTDTNKEREAFRKWAEQERVAGSVGDMEKGWLARASLAASAGSEPVSFTAEHVAYINRYGGRCRDCADEGGICPNRGLPCADAPKAIQFVLEALAYGINNGYINARVHPSPPEGAGAEQALLKVLAAVQRYLPPDGPNAKDTLSEIIAIVDLWPLGPLEKP